MVVETDRRVATDYNELKAEMARRDILREIAAAALSDRMALLVLRLVDAHVLPAGTEALRDSILHPDEPWLG
jgi:hypothetical protein